MLKVDIFRKNLKKKQMRKVSLRFWDNMIVFFVLSLIFIGNISLASTINSVEDSYFDVDEDFSSQLQLSLTDSNIKKAYDAVCLREPWTYIKSIDQVSPSSKSDYKVLSDYNVLTKSGNIKVIITKQVNVDTAKIRFISKKIFQNDIKISESENEVCIIYNERLTKIPVFDKANVEKFLVNSIEPLVDKAIVERPFFKNIKEFVVMTDKEPDFKYERKLFETDNFQFYVVKTSDLSSIINSDSIVKISEIKDEFLEKFVEFSKDLLSSEARNEIQRLKLKKTTKDCLELPDLKDYMDDDGWEIKQGQSSPYQQFITPDDSVIKELSKDKTVLGLYKISLDWIWVSDKTLNKKNEKWLLPNDFLLNTPSYSTNPIKGNPASDCSEQANTLVSLLRAKGIAAEDVRVALGKVDFDGSIGGHAWVEIKEDGKWLVLEPTSGPFYDDDSKTLVDRYGVGYDYWKYHPYPIVDVWCYYNDVYYTDECEDVADGWSNQYDVFTSADLLAGLLLEEPVDTIFIFAIIASVALISFVLIGSIRRKDMK